MKIRNGFVSNSSSSSFCIYGIADVDKDMIKESIQKKGIDTKGHNHLIGLLLQNYNLETHQPPYDDNYYVGREWSSIKDDETGKQFKDSIKKELTEIFGDDIKCDTYSEAWYDG